MAIARRHFLQMAGTLIFSAGLPLPARALSQGPQQVSFTEGVASGDPMSDSVLLWTRAESIAGSATPLLLQVSPSEDFREVLVETNVTAMARDDYTVRARINGLQAGTRYFYRFTAINPEDEQQSLGQSRTGRTLTAPALDDESPVRLAFASCQNYEQGYYGSWARMVEDDAALPEDKQIQFVLHLGDFIYERYRHDATEGQRFYRRLPPFPDGRRNGEREWAHTLADYRHLYKVYLRDPHLQEARARWPFVCTWDDHEFSNDGFAHFSTYDGNIVPELQRKRDANKAWFEYIPARVEADTDNLKIYRQLRWGKSVDLLITDLRSYRSAPPLPDGLADRLGLATDAVELVSIMDGGREYNNGNPPETLPFGDGTEPNIARNRDPGTLLGHGQKQWFKQRLGNSDATWKVWGNSLPILPLRLDLSSIPLGEMNDGILSEDAWAGYPGEQRELMSYLRDAGISGVVSLSGDHHMHAAGTLMDDIDSAEPKAVGADFNVTGISSTTMFDNVMHISESSQPEFRQLVSGSDPQQPIEAWNMTLTQGVLASMLYARTGSQMVADWLGPNKANPGLRYVDSRSNGYGLAEFTPKHCTVELVTVTDTGDSGATPTVHHRARFVLRHWDAGEQPVIEGPEFEGNPPFPYG